MGCASSKLDDLPAVALCRDRCACLDEAIHHRYALAEAHSTYIHSLRAVGHSLHNFFDQDLLNSSPGPPSPVLNLPPKRKGEPVPVASSSPPPAVQGGHHSRSRSHSNSGSHLHFHSDSDEDDSASGSLHHDGHLHSGSSSPVHPYGHIPYADNEIMNNTYPVGGVVGGGGGYMHMNYMKNQATPSVVYQRRPMSPPTMHMGESSSSSYYSFSYSNNQNPNYQLSNQNPSSSDYGYSNYGGFFGSSPPPSYGYSSQPTLSEASTSKPPPPPSPPRASPWEYLNPFESVGEYFPPYTPSRDSREVREEEGIPDLEDEDFQQEVVKEVHGDQKFVDGGVAGEGDYSKKVVDEEEDGKSSDLPSTSTEPDSVEYEVHMVEKNVLDKEEKPKDKGNTSGFNDRSGFRGDSDVLKEIQDQFEKASESGNELAEILEVGRLPHNRKHAIYQASKVLHLITPSSIVSTSLPSSSQSTAASLEKADLSLLDVDEVVGVGSRKLSSTMQKLYLWEKKLYEEIKAEEKMRVLHERKRQKLKRLDERGAEAPKIDATRSVVRSLSTKIGIAIQVVDKTSMMINKLRDEELWPQLLEFIQGLTKMWKSMRECHRSQCEAIREARRLDAIASHKHFSDAHLDATSRLEHDLLSWTARFSYWVGSQKGFVGALNNWLMKCIYYVPEETVDGRVPYSPGRIGAPPVFVICHQWAQALESISEKEVVDSMRCFANSVLQLWQHDKLEMQRRMMVAKDIDRKVRNWDMVDQKIQKGIQTLDKMVVLDPGDSNSLSVAGKVVYQSGSSKSGGFQASLQHIFEAMERFAADSLKTYEELLQRIEEDNLTQRSDAAS